MLNECSGFQARILCTSRLQRETFIPAHAFKAAGYKGTNVLDKHTCDAIPRNVSFGSQEAV
jgi:hypothetical protein